MDGFQPFKPSGPTFSMAVQTAANPPATLLGSGLAGDVTMRLYNQGPADCALAFGPTSAAASGSAVIPLLGGAAQNVFVVRAGETRALTLNGNFIFGAGIGLGSTTLLATPGFGIAG